MYFLHAITKLIVLILFLPLTIVIKSYTNWKTYRTLKRFKQDLREATTYEEWLTIANRIDKFLGKNDWRKGIVSKKFDFKLIYHRLHLLRDARKKNDLVRIVSIFSSGLIRNFGGISDKNLFNNSYLGTKIIIHDYISEVLNCLDFINVYKSQSYDYSELKLRFFHNAKQTFGNTALVLQGGSIFGMYHLGVIKTLYANKLLPKIISGSYFGSIFACLICLKSTVNNQPRENIFDGFVDELIEFGKKEEPELFNLTAETTVAFILNFYKKTTLQKFIY